MASRIIDWLLILVGIEDKEKQGQLVLGEITAAEIKNATQWVAFFLLAYCASCTYSVSLFLPWKQSLAYFSDSIHCKQRPGNTSS